MPVLLLHEDGSVVEFFMATSTSGITDSFEAKQLVKTLPTLEIVSLQEDRLRDVFLGMLWAFESLQHLGVIEAFWVHRSSLIALMRYGRFFGRFDDGNIDCVDDDLDFVVHLGNWTGDWPRFVRSFSVFAKQSGCGDCYMGATIDGLVADNGRYEKLLCLCAEVDGIFVIPLTIQRSEGDIPSLGNCSAYGSSVPCPADPDSWIGSYASGCLALPNITGRALTLSNSCTDWMTLGLRCTHVSQLGEIAKQLSGAGFISMREAWLEPACASMPVVSSAEVSKADLAGVVLDCGVQL